MKTDGPNQIGRENGRRRIVVYANTGGSDMVRVIADIRAVIHGTVAANALASGGYSPSTRSRRMARQSARS